MVVQLVLKNGNPLTDAPAQRRCHPPRHRHAATAASSSRTRHAAAARSTHNLRLSLQVVARRSKEDSPGGRFGVGGGWERYGLTVCFWDLVSVVAVVWRTWDVARDGVFSSRGPYDEPYRLYYRDFRAVAWPSSTVHQLCDRLESS